ncbi:MAG: hypothetical protein KME07_22745 [Pegethrix bostrychoides GSE-TBD4-15B]|jgi:Ca2+-binding RTX toxin-like protein|uniref:Calcium-binding protein n=1 Tax=Pegethrix bostrychoides GSE-TBD4-15B TaxID=2839662 RepID=A0A951U701_9CYAN|nr:hypothetical protein [Pegethrix bostrychoides GSE-TBD4-15B]
MAVQLSLRFQVNFGLSLRSSEEIDPSRVKIRLVRLSKGRRLRNVTLTVGDDLFSGSRFGDVIRGGAGDDQIWGLNGNDVINGNLGEDAIYGGRQNDAIDGGLGADELYGESGNDILDGGADDDFLSGGEGKDILIGDSGNDFLLGGTGSDLLQGGSGEDILSGQGGADIYRWTARDFSLSEIDQVIGFEAGTDRLSIRGFTFAPERITTVGKVTQFNVDGDAAPDLAVKFVGRPVSLTAADFVDSQLPVAQPRWSVNLALSASFSASVHLKR